MATTTLTGQIGQGKIITSTVSTGLFIHNEFKPTINTATLPTYNPYTGELLATVSAASATDIENAVESAELATHSWKHTAPAEKCRLLLRLADLIVRDTDEFALIHALDGGFVYKDVKTIDIPQAIETLRYFAGWADKIEGRIVDIPHGVGFTRREPLGVCAAIVPWNAPLMITIWKLAPAIAAGNTLIIKTPELTPLYGQKLGALIVEAGFPPGVVNILCGVGSEAGQALSEHSRVRKIAFTGSTATGRMIMKASAATNLKRVTLELGGKGPSIVFADADIENAVFWTSIGSSANNGQVCALGSRIYVQESIYDVFVEKFTRHARENPGITGNPLGTATTKGPITSRTQYEKVMGYVKTAQVEGARLLLGGEGKIVGGPEGSGVIENTVFADVREDMTIVREEVFGPVATIHRFIREEEVVKKANNTEYGLAAAVFTENVHTANRVAFALESGSVTVNCWGSLPVNMPFGGVKESGFGRDLGEDALESWTTTKCIKHWIFDSDSSS